MEGHLGKCGDVVNVEFREEIGSRVGRSQYGVYRAPRDTIDPVPRNTLKRKRLNSTSEASFCTATIYSLAPHITSTTLLYTLSVSQFRSLSVNMSSLPFASRPQ